MGGCGVERVGMVVVLGGVTVGHDPAVPDTHQFEMQWMKLLLPLGEHSLLHPLAKTLLICY